MVGREQGALKSNDGPAIAVLLAAHNGYPWIEAQVASIQAQAHVDVSIFVSVDSSTDETFEWCRVYAQHHANLILLPAVSLGSASQNFFRLFRDVALDGFDYVALSDQDDIWDDLKLHRAVQALGSKGVQAYSSNVTAFWADGREALIDKAQPQVKWDHYFEAAGPGCTYVLSKGLATAFRDLLLAHEDDVQQVSLHDWCLYAFARSRGFAWYIDPVTSMRYRQHAENVVGANVGLASLYARFRKISAGWWFAQVFLMIRLFGQQEMGLLKKQATPGFREYLFIALNFTRCRRRMRDKLFLLLVCIYCAFTRRPR
ncbi:glycosyltransferase [Pseudomonas silvicola]|nr:glycosyltransferase [Pseudomonas silvicola]